MGEKRPRLRALMRGLCEIDPRDRFRAARALGDHAEATWPESPEKVSDLLRRLAWLLNDESGATGWGAPEAVGEILARIPDLRPAFAPLLVSWLDDENVNLDQEALDAGTIWAMGRLGPGDPFAEKRVSPLLARFIAQGTSMTAGAALWAVGRLRLTTLKSEILSRGRKDSLRDAAETIALLIDGEVVDRTVGDLAEEALAALE